MDFQNARLILSNYLWDSNTPRELPENAVPQLALTKRTDSAQINRLLELAKQNHPEIQKLDLKAQQLRIDEPFGQKKMLKPRLDVRALLPELFTQNYYRVRYSKIWCISRFLQVQCRFFNAFIIS
ncbi:MAG: hypothetical protein R2822_28700 [Spirosomataceae bacterium]